MGLRFAHAKSGLQLIANQGWMRKNPFLFLFRLYTLLSQSLVSRGILSGDSGMYRGYPVLLLLPSEGAGRNCFHGGEGASWHCLKTSNTSRSKFDMVSL